MMLASLLSVLLFGYGYCTCPEFIGYDSLDEYESVYGETQTVGIKVELTDAMNSNGATCLDGSVGVFYWRKGFGDGINKFHVYLEGGGACAGIDTPVIDSFDTCAHRATTSLGSSYSYESTANFDSAYMSTNQSINPLTYNWNTAYVKYCDGSSYGSSNDTIARAANGIDIHFRGFRILTGVFDELMKQTYGYSNATDLLLSGCSAGGIGAILKADYVYHMPQNANLFVGAMPDSGFFLEYQGKGQLMTGIKWQYDWMNMSEINPYCLSAQAKGYEYLCLFAQEVAPYSFVDMFCLQSRFDSWQTEHELGSTNAADINVYGNNLTDTIMQTYLLGSKHKMFLDSCHHHCGEWNDIIIDGYTSSTAQYEWYTLQTKHGPFWFQNNTYPCESCC